MPPASPPVAVRGDERVLVILMGSLGDVARGLSIVEPLKAAIPKGRLIWLVEPACEGLVRLHPKIDRTIVFDRPNPVKGLIQLRRELRAEGIDICLDLQRHMKSGFLSSLSGARTRVGFHKRNAKERNHWFQTDTIPEFPIETPKQRCYYAFLEQLGVPAPQPGCYGLRGLKATPMASEVRALLGAGYAAVLMGSSWPSKGWPQSYYRDLIKLLLERTTGSVVLVGSKSEAARAESVIGGLDGRAINVTGKTTLGDLCGILEKARVVIGPDSGPGHLASLLGVPVISLFGPTSPKRTAPVGSEPWVMKSKLGCSPCYLRRCPGLGSLCMESIEPVDVLSLVEQLRALR